MCKQEENVVLISLGKLQPFPGHPFQVRDDQLMQQLVDSIRNVGVLVPAIVRKTEDGAYQLIGGHRRKHACEILGLDTLPCIIRDLDDNEATIMMVDSNFQRETILPSEKAKAYKMKLDCIKRQGARTDLTSDQTGLKLPRKTSRELIAENSPDSSTQIQRFIRLNELIPELLQLVDEGKLAITPAVEISYLREDEQKMLQLTINMDLIEMIKATDGFMSLAPANINQIRAAEEALGVVFASDYCMYLEAFGVAAIGSDELTGICSSDRLNVIKATERARAYFNAFPSNMYVVEELSFDHLFVVQDKEGIVYEYGPSEKPKKIAQSLMAYLFE